MARREHRLAENAAGELFVDRSCIDCQTCRIVAPESFGALARGSAYVARQPSDERQWLRALMALVSCPTSSIGTEGGRRARQAARSFPEPLGRGVYYCGYASESSFGASSYLVVRAAGNVLVDSPRAAGPLLDGIAALGGVGTMFLTHRDDVADHARFRLRFGCERVMHALDIEAHTADVEVRIEGDKVVRLAPDLEVVPVPGHTRGSMALLHDGVLFTGDHLWASESSGRLHASRSVCWHSWSAQLRSLARLLDLDFDWALPGHGMRYRAASPAAMKDDLRALLARLGPR